MALGWLLVDDRHELRVEHGTTSNINFKDAQDRPFFLVFFVAQVNIPYADPLE